MAIAPLFAAVVVGHAGLAMAQEPVEPRHDSAPPRDHQGLIGELEALLDGVEPIEDVEAAFTQVRESSALRRSVTSSGVVRLCGQTTHWVTTEPYPSHMWVRNGEVTYYYPDDGLVEVYDLSAVADRLVIGPSIELDTLRDQFILTPGDASDAGGLSVRLTPRHREQREYFLPMDILIDRGSGHLRSVNSVDADGNRTSLVFSKIRTNLGLREDDLEPAWPSGVTVRRTTLGAERLESATSEGHGNNERR